MSKSVHNQSGQVLLLVVLAMSVATTLALSVVARSITDVSITTNEDESLRALSAAEAGVEQALVASISPGENLSGDLGITSTDQEATFTTDVSSFPNSSKEYVYPVDLLAGDTATVWFIDHDADGQPDDSCSPGTCFTGSELRLCWGRDGTPRNNEQTPAIVTSVVYNDGSPSLKVASYTTDPYNARLGDNNFSPINSQNCTIASDDFQFRRDIDLAGDLGIPASVYNNPGSLKFMRIQTLYNTAEKHSLGVQVLQGSSLPSQGKKVDSLGTSGVSNRKIEVFSLFPEPPAIFDSAVFSGNTLTK